LDVKRVLTVVASSAGATGLPTIFGNALSELRMSACHKGGGFFMSDLNEANVILTGA
jgi:hypothetical protein